MQVIGNSNYKYSLWFMVFGLLFHKSLNNHYNYKQSPKTLVLRFQQ
jgi:hypothetical protein